MAAFHTVQRLDVLVVELAQERERHSVLRSVVRLLGLRRSRQRPRPRKVDAQRRQRAVLADGAVQPCGVGGSRRGGINHSAAAEGKLHAPSSCVPSGMVWSKDGEQGLCCQLFSVQLLPKRTTRLEDSVTWQWNKQRVNGAHRQADRRWEYQRGHEARAVRLPMGPLPPSGCQKMMQAIDSLPGTSTSSCASSPPSQPSTADCTDRGGPPPAAGVMAPNTCRRGQRRAAQDRRAE